MPKPDYPYNILGMPALGPTLILIYYTASSAALCHFLYSLGGANDWNTEWAPVSLMYLAMKGLLFAVVDGLDHGFSWKFRVLTILIVDLASAHFFAFSVISERKAWLLASSVVPLLGLLAAPLRDGSRAIERDFAVWKTENARDD